MDQPIDFDWLQRIGLVPDPSFKIQRHWCFGTTKLVVSYPCESGWEHDLIAGNRFVKDNPTRRDVLGLMEAMFLSQKAA